MKTLTPNEEIRELGNMLFATDADDAPRLLSICKRVFEIAAANTVEDKDPDGNPYVITPESELEAIKKALEP